MFTGSFCAGTQTIADDASVHTVRTAIFGEAYMYRIGVHNLRDSFSCRYKKLSPIV